MKNPRVVIAGGSGSLGRMLAKDFMRRQYEVVILTRHPGRAVPGTVEQAWDGKTIGPWLSSIDGAEVLINVAGRSVDCRYTAANRRAILDSRVDSTRVLGIAVQKCVQPPLVWLNSSTATIYQHSLDTPMGEGGAIGATPAAKDKFSVQVATEWEAALMELKLPATRKIALRTAMVLDRDGGVYPVLRRLAGLGLGGTMASGRQYVSWIHADDFCRAITWLIEHKDLQGPINVCAPNPIPNRTMMAAFREVAGQPFGLPASAWMLEAGAFVMRTETELILKSRRVVPERLLASGFCFKYPVIEPALRALSA